jgi:hypothetical protein
VKLWHESERRMGHTLDHEDMVCEFTDRLEHHIAKLSHTEKLSDTDSAILEIYKGKLAYLQKAQLKYRRQFAYRLCAKLGVHLLAPQRYCQLSPKEEAVRCELTWQQFDERLWLAACAGKEELSRWVADPEQFACQRADAWLVFSDQIPFWVKIGFQKVLYAEYELANFSSKR